MGTLTGQTETVSQRVEDFPEDGAGPLEPASPVLPGVSPASHDCCSQEGVGGGAQNPHPAGASV